MAKEKRDRLVEGLVRQGLITQEQLRQAKEEAEKSREPLRKVLTKLGFVNEEDIIAFLGEQLGVPYIDLKTYLIDPKIVKLVPENLARRWQIIPLFKIEKVLTVAMVDPLNVYALDELRHKTRCEVEPMVSTESDIQATIDQYYGVTGSMEEVIKSIDKEKLALAAEEPEGKKLEAVAEQAPVIKLVNLIIMQAIRGKASDIHIEPDELVLRTRYRVDGILHEVTSPPKHLQSAIISRIKVMANLDIAERRIPQDGRIVMKMENREIDLRISTFPTVFGENVVMRILDKSSLLLGLEQLGFLPETLQRFEAMIKRPYGVVFVTGPTGSGKTTTLYAALSKISTIAKNIITLEDPVEYQIDLVRQSQINPKAGLTFATGLRSMLRQDPDIIMVGEVRDFETAEIVIHAALTGHLVFTTLHTNDAPGALTRLIDMGVEPFLISSSAAGALAQRLVRTICPPCKEVYEPSPEILRELGLELSSNQPAPTQRSGSGKPVTRFYRGKGCRHCNQTGYKGRMAIFELMTLDEKIRELVITKAPATEIKKAARKRGMMTLREDGLEKALKGITTVEEVLRVTQEE